MDRLNIGKEKKRSVPVLRFKEFEGEWALFSFSELIIKANQGVNTTTEKVLYSNKGNVVVRSNNIGVNYISLDEVKYVDVETFARIKASCKPKFGDILYCNIGSALGSAALFELNEPIVINWNVFRIQHNSSIVDNRLLVQSLNRMKRTIRKYATQSTMPFISSKAFKYIKFNFPSLPEQKKIASFLSTIDQKIQQLTRKKELLEQYKKGLMQQLFSGALRFKDEEGKEYPRWEEKRLGDVCIINPRNSELPSSFTYIDLESVSKGQLIKENEIKLSEAPSRAQRNLLIEDILYQTVRPYQRNNLFFDKIGNYVASTGYAQIRAKENARYIYQLVHTSTFVNKVLLRCTGTSYPAINSSELGKIQIYLPCISEQEKIANYLFNIDTKIKNVTIKIQKTKTFKKGLLQQMFV